MTTLKAPDHWLKSLNVWVVGAGGNGGEAVDALAQFHTALLALGHPTGIRATIIDDATVREANLVRQRFWAGDLGQPKATTLANRYNLLMGCQWQGLPLKVEDVIEHMDSLLIDRPDLIITAVDTPSARRAVHGYVTARGYNFRPLAWLDLGNKARNGQAVLGMQGDKCFAPNVMDLYPELADMADDTTKSCSTAEAIAVQDCLINRMVSAAGMSLIWELLRHGETDKNGVVLDLASGRQVPIPLPTPKEDAA